MQADSFRFQKPTNAKPETVSGNLLDTNQLANETNNNDFFWTIVSAIAAVLSALYAFRSNLIAKKALAISQKEYANKQADFDLYVINSYRWTLDKEPKRKFLLFNITIKNKSETASSFVANLEIEYINTDNVVSRIILEHNPDLVKEMPKNEITPFPKDLRVEGKGIESKWFIFEQPIDVFRGQRIEKYSIKTTDTHGNFSTAEVVIIKELIK